MAGGFYPDLNDTLEEEIGQNEITIEPEVVKLEVGNLESQHKQGLPSLAPNLKPALASFGTAWGKWSDPALIGTDGQIKFLIENKLHPGAAASSLFKRLGNLENHNDDQMKRLRKMAQVLAPEFAKNGTWKDTVAAVRQGVEERLKKHEEHQQRLKDAFSKLGDRKDTATTELKAIIEKRIAVNEAKFEKETWQITRALQKAANPDGYDPDINKWCTENIERCGQREQDLRMEGRSLAQSFYSDYSEAPSKFFDKAVAEVEAPRFKPTLRPMPPRPAEGVAKAAQQAASQVAPVAPVSARPAVAPQQPRGVPAHIRRMQNSLQGHESLDVKRAAQLASNIQGAAAIRDGVGAIVQRSNATMDPVAPLRDSAGDRIKFTSDQTAMMHVLEIASGVLQKEMAKESSAYLHIDKLASSIETTVSGFYSGSSRGGPDQASLDAYHVVADAAAWGLSPEQNEGQHGQPAFFERPEYVDAKHLRSDPDNNEVWAGFAEGVADDARRAARMGPAAFKAEGPVNADLKLARAEFAALRAPHDASEANVHEAVHEALRLLEAPDQAKPKDGAPPKPGISLGHIGEVMRSYVRESHAGDLQTRALAAVSRVAEWCTNHASRAVPETSMGNAGRPGPSLDRAGAARDMAELAQEAQAMRQSYQPEGKKVSKAQARAYDMQDRGLAGAKEIGAAAKLEKATLAKLDAWEAASKAKAARTGDFTDDARRGVEAWKVKKPDAEEQGKGRSR